MRSRGAEVGGNRNSGEDGGATRRLFFALWPEAPVREAIRARRRALGRLSRKRVPGHNLHLTLLFLGNQPAVRVDAILEAAATVRGSEFMLRLDRFGHFARARVVWLGGEAPVAGSALAASLAAAMEGLGLIFEHRPWRPHVTLFRGVTRRPALPAPAPVDWRAARFSLVESLPSRPYQVLRSWPLD